MKQVTVKVNKPDSIDEMLDECFNCVICDNCKFITVCNIIETSVFDKSFWGFLMDWFKEYELA